jgi:hypothetical protein
MAQWTEAVWLVPSTLALATAVTTSFEHCRDEIEPCDRCMEVEDKLDHRLRRFFRTLVDQHDWPVAAYMEPELLMTGGFAQILCLRPTHLLNVSTGVSQRERSLMRRAQNRILKIAPWHGLRYAFVEYCVLEILRATMPPSLWTMLPLLPATEQVPYRLHYFGPEQPQLGFVSPHFAGDVIHAMDRGEMGDKEMLQLIAELCILLEEAQRGCQFMHRDLKPNNIFYQPRLESQTVILTMPGTSQRVVFEDAWLRYYLGDFGMSTASYHDQRVGADTWHDSRQLLPSMDLLTLFMYLHFQMRESMQATFPAAYAVLQACLSRVEGLAVDLVGLEQFINKNTPSPPGGSTVEQPNPTVDAVGRGSAHPISPSFIPELYRVAIRHGASAEVTPRRVFKEIADMYAQFQFTQDVSFLGCFGPTSFSRLAAISAALSAA